MDFEEIQKNIEKGRMKILEKRLGKRSPAWDLFGPITNAKGKIIKDVVGCRKCKEVKRKNEGTTSNLLSHKCVGYLGVSSKTPAENNDSPKVERTIQSIPKKTIKRALSECVPLDNQLFPSGENSKLAKVQTVVPTALKKTFSQAVTACVILDNLPLSLPNGEGFKLYTQHILKVGQQFGSKINITDLLPEPTSVSSDITKLYERMLRKFKENINLLKYAAITTDLWSDNYHRNSYLGITLHFCDGKSQIIEKVLSIEHFDCSTTEENISLAIEKVLEGFDVDIKSIVFVTDRSRQMMKADTRLNCFNHLLNQVLEKAVANPDFEKFVSTYKTLVLYLKSSTNLMDNLGKTLKTYGPPRWSRIFKMLNSVFENFDNILKILKERSLAKRFPIENERETLSAIVQFFKVFFEASVHLEGSNYPTLYLCLPYYYKFLKNVEPEPTDILMIENFKNSVKIGLESKLKEELKMWHKAATFLYPICKDLNNFNLNEKEEIYDFLENLNIIRGSDTMKIEDDCIADPEPGAVPSLFAAFVDNSRSKSVLSFKEELKLYLSDKTFKQENDVMEWWSTNKEYYKHLYECSRKIFCIPATSAPSERMFSKLWTNMTEERCNIKTNSLSQSLFLQTNFSKAELEGQIKNM